MVRAIRCGSKGGRGGRSFLCDDVGQPRGRQSLVEQPALDEGVLVERLDQSQFVRALHPLEDELLVQLGDAVEHGDEEIPLQLFMQAMNKYLVQFYFVEIDGCQPDNIGCSGTKVVQ